MIYVDIQVRQNSQEWEETKRINHKFNSDKEVEEFANQLSKQLECEVRVNYTDGSGSYYRNY